MSGTLIVSGCRESRPQAPKAIGTDTDPMAAARDAMDRRDYGVAVRLLREALVRQSADVEAHYRLGVSTSHLDQLEEAGREFEWVVAHGVPAAPEVQLAREWLAARTTAATAAPSVSPAQNDGPAQRPELASLSGRAVGPDQPLPRLQLFLKGLPDGAVKNEYHLLRTDQQGSFHFSNVVPGDYMLTNAIAGSARWRLKVTLAQGQRLVLDLSASNETAVRDDFPERGR